MKIPFFQISITGKETTNVDGILKNGQNFAANGYIEKCERWFIENHGLKNFYLTKSCSQSLELAALILNLKENDEVIMPSYALVACGNAFALRGAKCVFVDIDKATMNIDATKIEAAISPKTKAILTINYAGVGCNYDEILRIKNKHNLYLIEDNAHGTGAKWQSKFLGTFGDISTFSFDHMKSISCGQGGGISINNERLMPQFFISYESGTNRQSFFRNETNKYEWKGLGSNYRLSELNAAMLFAQLESEKEIIETLGIRWKKYYNAFKALAEKDKIEIAETSNNANHNSHCFYIKTGNINERNALIKFLAERDIQAQFHYVPLHSSEYGKRWGRFVGEDKYTTAESERLLRLPLYFNMTDEEQARVISGVEGFYATEVKSNR